MDPKDQSHPPPNSFQPSGGAGTPSKQQVNPTPQSQGGPDQQQQQQQQQQKQQQDLINSPDIDPLDSSGMDTNMTSASNAGNQGPQIGLGIHGNGTGNGASNTGAGNGGGGAQGGVPQPKVHTAFIHKLYNMLEDPSIQHLIAWSQTNDSFMMTPCNEFSRVLSQYFKHTNVSSFVRQLNMYGFHKVNDVFHTGPPDSTVWEFKHGNGSFKRGDLNSLREIKRRASRNVLIHRDSFSGASQRGGPHHPGSGAGTPGNEHGTDQGDGRLMHIENMFYAATDRLARVESDNALLSSRCSKLTDGLLRSHQYNITLSRCLARLLDPGSAAAAEIQNLQQELERQIQSLEEPLDTHMHAPRPFSGSIHITDFSAPLSPRQLDDSRRPSFATPSSNPPSQSGGGYFRPPPLPTLSMPSNRRLGSVSTGPSSPTSGASLRPPLPGASLSPFSAQGPHSHLSRRHTSADIRQHGWTNPGPSPFNTAAHSHSMNGSAPPPPPLPTWGPASPQKTGYDSAREQLARYEIGRASVSSASPFAAHENRDPTNLSETGWNFERATKGFKPQGQNGNLGPMDGPMGPMGGARRGSLATNSVHLLLNPEAAAGPGPMEEDVDPLTDDRKRKRLV